MIESRFSGFLYVFLALPLCVNATRLIKEQRDIFNSFLHFFLFFFFFFFFLSFSKRRRVGTTAPGFWTFIFPKKQIRVSTLKDALARGANPKRERTRTKTAACLSPRRLSTRPTSRPREEDVLLQQQQEVEDLRIKNTLFTNTEIRNVAMNGRRRVQTKNEEEETWIERRVNSRRR